MGGDTAWIASWACDLLPLQQRGRGVRETLILEPGSASGCRLPRMSPLDLGNRKNFPILQMTVDVDPTCSQEMQEPRSHAAPCRPSCLKDFQREPESAQTRWGERAGIHAHPAVLESVRQRRTRRSGHVIPAPSFTSSAAGRLASGQQEAKNPCANKNPSKPKGLLGFICITDY